LNKKASSVSSLATTPESVPAKKVSKRKQTQANRTQKIRQRLHQELRDKFKGNEYIKQLETCAGDLANLQASMATARKKKLTLKDREKIIMLNQTLDIYQMELNVIKTRIDLNIKRLKFVLPELRSIAITDEDGNNPLATLGSALSQLTKSLSET